MRAQPVRTPEGAARIMKIHGTGGAIAGASGNGARQAGGASFSLPAMGAAIDTRSAAAPRQAGGIESLLALQGVDDPGERRRRTVQRGRGALDALDDLKIALLSGSFDRTRVDRLRAAAAGLQDSSGDPGLDAVMSDIELRVEVELAKAERLQA